jgi:alpha-galactosidase
VTAHPTQLHDVCNETLVMDIANEILSNGMYDAGYTHINLDGASSQVLSRHALTACSADCWADMERDAQGNIQWDPARFPSGLPTLINWLHTRGFKFGLYTSAGDTTCSSGQRPHSIPGSYGHYQQDANSFAQWGVCMCVCVCVCLCLCLCATRTCAHSSSCLRTRCGLRQD